MLPPMREGQRLPGVAAEARGHETQPPARYTEASLVRELEERGIGRPSTYASIIQTVQDRGYAWKKGSALVPTFTAFAVVNLLEQHFPELVDLEFTARMEDELDAVASGSVEAVPWLHEFYFGDPDSEVEGVAERGAQGTASAAAGRRSTRAAVSSIPLGEDADGRAIAVRVGRYGPYVAGRRRGRAREHPRRPRAGTSSTSSARSNCCSRPPAAPSGSRRSPRAGAPVYVKSGRYGPYVQLGEDDEDGGKPKRSGLWPGMTMETLTAEQALELLTYPRTLGVHPESNEPVTVAGRPERPVPARRLGHAQPARPRAPALDRPRGGAAAAQGAKAARPGRGRRRLSPCSASTPSPRATSRSATAASGRT